MTNSYNSLWAGPIAATDTATDSIPSEFVAIVAGRNLPGVLLSRYMSERPTTPDDGNDWIARHARCRPGGDGPSVIVKELDEDWDRRHAETRRSRTS